MKKGSSQLKLVKEFHEKFNCPIGDKPAFIPIARERLRMDLILEETEELAEALLARDIEKVIDALGDLSYVVHGMAIEFGIDLDRAVEIIHASNMSKLGPDGKPIYRKDGKVLKGPGFFPPDFREMLK